MGDLGHIKGREESLDDPVGHGGEGGRGGKVGGMGPAPLRGGWGKGEFPMIRGAHPRCGDQQGWGETFGGLGDWGIGGEHRQHFPQLLRPGSLLGSRA